MKRPPLMMALLGLLVLGVAALSPAAASAQTRVQDGSIPAGFSLLLQGRGVSVYLHEETEENEEGEEIVVRQEVVQVIDLSTGARVALHHGPIVETGRGDGIYGGPSPRIQRQYLETVWYVAMAQPDAFCVSNGTFFLDTENGARVDPTELSFPLKRDGLLISEGHESRRFRYARVMLELWDDHAAIVPLSRQALYASSAPNIVTGLSSGARLRSLAEVGRSWIGTADRDGDRLHETIYLYSALAVTQARAEQVMRAFGASGLLMLDGGGSTQVICEGDGYITQSRPLPQTIITLQAPPPPLPWPILRTPVFGCCSPLPQ
jgi:hypothetical protein